MQSLREKYSFGKRKIFYAEAKGVLCIEYRGYDFLCGKNSGALRE
jgi:hypothetical protein